MTAIVPSFPSATTMNGPKSLSNQNVRAFEFLAFLDTSISALHKLSLYQLHQKFLGRGQHKILSLVATFSISYKRIVAATAHILSRSFWVHAAKMISKAVL